MEAHRWARPQWHRSISSTQTHLLADPVPGRVVVAEHQSAGQGRRGRVWTAPAGTSLAISVALPAPAAEVLGWVPLLSGLAVLRALRSSRYAVPAALKWPNDVLVPDPEIGWGKVCGVLAHVVPAEGGAGRLDEPWATGGVVVVGAGLNIDQTRDQLPAATTTSTATSWRLARGGGECLPAAASTAWVGDYLQHLADLLGQLSRDPGAVRSAYREQCRTLGRRVRVELPDGGFLQGLATDVEKSGALVVYGPQGRSVHHAGDVVHVRPG